MRIGYTQTGVKVYYDVDSGAWLVHWDEDRTKYDWCLDGNGFVRHWPDGEKPIVESTLSLGPKFPLLNRELPISSRSHVMEATDRNRTLLVRIGVLLHELEEYLGEKQSQEEQPGYRFYCKRTPNHDDLWGVWDKEKDMEVAGPFPTYMSAQAQRDRLELVYGDD